MPKKPQLNWIASFWRRIGALFIDTLILGLVGFLSGLAFESAFVQLGNWGRLIGLSIALLYFGVMNSELFAGQTIGKKLLKLRVVNLEGKTISLGRSTLRYLVLTIPFSLSGVRLSNEAIASLWVYPISLITFGGAFSILYLYVFNRVTRQTLHDLAVGTLVVNANTQRQEVGRVWKTHLIVVAGIFIVAAIAPIFSAKLAKSELFKDMLTAQSALTAESGVTYAAISTLSTTSFSSTNDKTKTTNILGVQAILATNQIDDVDLARKLAATVVQNYPESRNKDTLQITLIYGYDIGIWSKWSSSTQLFDPDEFANVR